MMSLGGWMNKILIGWGIDPKFADMFDETIIALLMVGLSIGLDYLCQAIFVGGMKHYTRRSPHQWNTLLMKRRVIHHLIHILPGWLTTSFPSEQATRWDSTYPSHGNSASTSSPYITTSRRTRIGESTWESAGDTVLSISTVTMPC